MDRRALLIAGIAAASAVSSADPVRMLSTADEIKLRALYEQLLEGWNCGSGAAFAAVFDSNADLVGPAGFHIKGREQIASFHQVLFDGYLKGTELVGVVRNLRLITDDVAIGHAIGGPRRPSDPESAQPRKSVHTFVASRRNGNWSIDSFQNTPI